MTPPGTQAVYSAPYRDRRTQLIACGVLEILIGLFCALMVPLMGFTLAVAAGMPAGTGVNAGMMAPALLLYAGLAVFFVWIGVGTIRLLRWARALMLAISSLWLIGGAIGMVLWLWMMPRIFPSVAVIGPTGTSTPALSTWVQIVVSVFAAGLYVGLPALFLLCYRGEDVRATVEAADPQPRWTDRCPQPVLALVVILGYSALSCLFVLGYRAVPFFGIVLTGLPAVAAAIGLAVLLGFLTREVYLLRPAGWWGSFALLLLAVVSSGLTFAGHSMSDFYRAMGYSAQQLEMMSTTMLDWQPVIYGLGIGGFLVGMGYLLYLRRFFVVGAPASSEADE